MVEEEKYDQKRYVEKFLEMNEMFIEQKIMSREGLLEMRSNINPEIMLGYGLAQGIVKLAEKLEKETKAKQPSTNEVNEDQSAKRVSLAVKEFNEQLFVKKELSKHPLGSRDSKDREHVDKYIDVLEGIVGKGASYSHLTTIEIQRVVQKTLASSLKRRLQDKIAVDATMDLTAMCLFLRTQLRSTLKIEKSIKTLTHIQVGHLKGGKTTQNPEINEFITHFEESIEEIQKHLPTDTKTPPVMIITWLHEACRPMDSLFSKLSSIQWKGTVTNEHGIQVATEATVTAYKESIVEKAKEISPNGDGVLQLQQKPKPYKELYAFQQTPHQGGAKPEGESKWQKKGTFKEKGGQKAKVAKAIRKSTCSTCSGWNHNARDCRIPTPVSSDTKARIVDKFQKWNKVNGFKPSSIHFVIKGKKKKKDKADETSPADSGEDPESD